MSVSTGPQRPTTWRPIPYRPNSIVRVPEVDRAVSPRRVSPRLVQSISGAARQLGVTELTIRRRIRDGKLPAVQIGGSWRLRGPGFDRLCELPEECTVRQVAHSLYVAEITLWRWVRDGHIPASKRGRMWMIKRSDLEGLLKLEAS
jgi:excisionase family DNA binding protein